MTDARTFFPVATIDVAAALNSLAIGLEEAAALQEGMLALAEMEDCPPSLILMSRLTGKLLDDAMHRQIDIAAWCRKIDMERIEQEKATAEQDGGDITQGAAIAHKLAQELEAICAPALRACHSLRDKSADIDAMAAKARGLMRSFHAIAQAQVQPSPGPLRSKMEDASTLRPDSLSAVSEQARRATQATDAGGWMP